MVEKRKNERKKAIIKTIVKRKLFNNTYAVMEFQSNNLSLGGVFISTEDLSLFDLGDEIEILVDDNGQKYYEGTGRIVRSAHIFSDDNIQLESGYGLMFLEPSKELKNMLIKKMNQEDQIIL